MASKVVTFHNFILKTPHPYDLFQAKKIRLDIKELNQLEIEFLLTVKTPIQLSCISIGRQMEDDNGDEDDEDNVKNHDPIESLIYPLSHSYIESLGSFIPQETPYRYILRKFALNQTEKVLGNKNYLMEQIVIDSNGDEHLHIFYELVVHTPIISFFDPEPRKSPSEEPQKSIWGSIKKKFLPQEIQVQNQNQNQSPNTSPNSSPNQSPTSSQDFQEDKNEKRTTSEFMKEIGSWLYSTSAMQSILKYGDEKARFNDIKSSFDASTIWMMGKPYIFQGQPINSETNEKQQLHVQEAMKDSLILQSEINKPPITLQRYGPLGDAYSVRIVKKTTSISNENLFENVYNYLLSNDWEVNRLQNFVLEAEDKCENPQMRNYLILQYLHLEGNQGILDISFFGIWKKNWFSEYFPIGERDTVAVKKQIEKLNIFHKKLHHFFHSSKEVELMFAEGFFVNVYTDFELKECFASKVEENLTDSVCRVLEGEFLWLGDKGQSKRVQLKLNDEVLSLYLSENQISESSENNSIQSLEKTSNSFQIFSLPIELFSIVISVENQTFEIIFHETVYSLKTDSLEEFTNWTSSFNALAGRVADSEKSNKNQLNFCDWTFADFPSSYTQFSSNQRSLSRTDSHPNHQILLSFINNFYSIFWFTYRHSFPKITPTILTSDVGWGCMFRTTQMMLGQAFSVVLLKRGWSLQKEQTDDELKIYRQILSWFADNFESQSYYSIHNMARVGKKFDKKIGEWFGPTTAAYVMRYLSTNHQNSPITFFVNQEQIIYADIFEQHATGAFEGREDGQWKPTLILLPVRLGVESVNPIYYNSLKELFTYPQFLGIAGGKPCKSLYFVASQDEEFYYLDPHILQPYLDLKTQNILPIKSYHCDVVRRLQLHQLDPSMLLGFLIESKEDFIQFEQTIQNQKGKPIFAIQETAPKYAREQYLSELKELRLMKEKKQKQKQSLS